MLDFFKKRSYKFWLSLTIIFTIPAFYQLLRPGFFPMQDDLQAFRVQQMVKCLKDFQIPCRWIPDMGYQYGYPQFNYYGPMPYYLGAVFNLLGIQVIDSVKILFILGFILAAISMFMLLKTFFNQQVAFFGAVIYTFAPFKAAQVFVRGSLSEFLTFIFLPMLFWSSYQIIKQGSFKYILWFSTALFLLLTTHNLTSVIFMPVLLIWISVITLSEKNWRNLTKILLGFSLGGALSAFYFLPVVFERDLVHMESLLSGYFDYRQHFVSIRQLFLSNYFGYGSSVLGLGDEVALSTGIIHWVSALWAFILSVVFLRKEKYSKAIIAMFFVSLIVLFLIHQKSSFIWQVLPILHWLQFPWRFLTISVFLLSFLGAAGIYILSRYNRKLAIILAALFITGAFLLHANFFKPREWYDISDKEKFSGQNWEKQLTISIFDYLPIAAKLPPNKKAPEQPEVLEGDVKFLSYKKGSNFQIGEAVVAQDSTIRLPLFDFPRMVVKVDGDEIIHRNNDCRGQDYCFGLITFDLKKGRHSIEARLQDTSVRIMGNFISLLSITMLMFFIIKKYVFKKIH